MGCIKDSGLSFCAVVMAYAEKVKQWNKLPIEVVQPPPLEVLDLAG